MNYKTMKLPVVALAILFLSMIQQREADAKDLPDITGVYFENKSSENLIVSMIFTFVGQDGFTYYRLYSAPPNGVGPNTKLRLDDGRFDLSKRYYVIIHRPQIVAAAPDWGYVGWSNDVRGAKVDRAQVPGGMKLFPKGIKNKFVAIEVGNGNFQPLKNLVNANNQRSNLATRIEPLGNYKYVKVEYAGNGNGNITVR